MARGSLARRLLVAGTVVCVARWTLEQGKVKPAPVEVPEDLPEAALAPAPPRRAFRRRLATGLVFSTLFFTGAAFTAGAGNQLVQIDDSSTAAPTVVADAATVPVADEAAPVEAAADPDNPNPNEDAAADVAAQATTEDATEE